jgi:hypothetical protein
VKRAFVLLCLAVVSIGFPSSALGQDGEPTTFTGSCQFSGSVKYPNPPLQFTPTVTPEFVRATGPCTGQFGDETLDGDTVKLEFESTGPLSCALGGSTQGTGVLKFRGQKLDFSLEETRPPGIVSSAVLEGDSGGSGQMTAIADFKGGQGESAIRKCQRSAERPQTGIHLVPVNLELTAAALSG